MSRTQISTQDVTQLCHEIRDIKKGQINNRLPDDLSKTSSNIPGQWDRRDKDAPGYAESVYNKLCRAPPSDTHDSPAHRDSSPPPTPSLPPQTLPEPTPSRTPSPTPGTSIGIPYVTVAPGSGESPAVAENRCTAGSYPIFLGGRCLVVFARPLYLQQLYYGKLPCCGK